MPQENGKLSLSTLTRLSVGGYLTTAAANSFERLRLAGARDGVNVTITSTADAYREYAIQERIFTERYIPTYTQYASGRVDRRYWQGRYWFRRAGTAAAAVPGTSNHGWAIAIDIANVGGFNSTFYRWLSDNAPALGWSNDEGHSVGEAWHWTYKSGSDNGGGGGTSPSDPDPTPAPTPKPIPLPEEEDTMFRIRVATSPSDPSQIGKVYVCQFGPTGHVLFRHISPGENALYDLIKVPVYNVDHAERDSLRNRLITLEANWKVGAV